MAHSFRLLQDSSLKNPDGSRTGVNKVIDYTSVSSVFQTSLHEVMHECELTRRMTGLHAGSMVMDLASYFRQLRMHKDDTHANLVQDDTGRLLRDNRLSMGSVSSPAIATTISTAIAEAIVRRSIFTRWTAPVWSDTPVLYGPCLPPRWDERGLSNIALSRIIRVLVYVDDMLLLGRLGLLDATAAYLWRQLPALGFPLSMRKALQQGLPAATTDYIGYRLDLTHGVVTVPEDKKREVRSILTGLLKSKRISIAHLRSLVGKLTFIGAALYVCRPFLRPLYERLALALDHRRSSRSETQSYVYFHNTTSDRAWLALEFFHAALAGSPGRSFPRPASVCSPRLFTDASVTGFGALLEVHDASGNVIKRFGM